MAHVHGICHGHPWHVPRNASFISGGPWHGPWMVPWTPTVDDAMTWIMEDAMESTMDYAMTSTMPSPMAWPTPWYRPWSTPCTGESYPPPCGPLYDTFALNLVVCGLSDPKNIPDHCTNGYKPLNHAIVVQVLLVTLVSTNVLITPWQPLELRNRHK